MSHYVVLVIGDCPEEQLEPFDENLVVEPYIVGEVSEKEKQRMLEFYNKERSSNHDTFDACYAEYGNDWDGNRCKKENGVWVEYSTYNPDSKWDWYSLGGRWSGRFIKLKEGATGIVGECGAFGNSVGVDQALKKDIDFEKIDKTDFIPYAVLYEGEWISRGDMGWWGITLTEHYTDKDWEDKVWELIDSTSDDTLFSFYDLHI